MGVLVDAIGVQAVNELLELGVIQDLSPDPGGVARVVRKLDRVDCVHLEESITFKRFIMFVNLPQIQGVAEEMLLTCFPHSRTPRETEWTKLGALSLTSLQVQMCKLVRISV